MIDKPQAIFIPRCDVDEDILRHITDDTFTCEETQIPKTFTHNGAIKLSEKYAQSIKRAIRKSQKIPRKLKNALRHIELVTGPIINEETEHGIRFTQRLYIRTKEGYPTTKWVRKAMAIIKKQYAMIMKGASK